MIVAKSRKVQMAVGAVRMMKLATTGSRASAAVTGRGAMRQQQARKGGGVDRRTDGAEKDRTNGRTEGMT